jgi:uncharacterized damage-inducible protein DinB
MLTPVDWIDYQQAGFAMKLAQLYCQESVHLLDAAMKKIEHCLAQLSDDQIWWRPANDANSVGNLLLHLSGNLRQWAVTPLSGEPDSRDRESEFAQRDGIDRAELFSRLSQTIAQVRCRIEHLDEQQLMQKRHIQGFETTTLGAISHTTSHFVGHTHQIILLTRLQLGESYQFEWTPESPRPDSRDVPI